MDDGLEAPVIREVTAAECEHFYEHGWVFLPGLVDASTAARLLADARQLLGDSGDGERPAERMNDRTGKNDLTIFHDYYNPSADSSAFAAVSLSAAMGRNASELLGGGTPIRRYEDLLGVKLPVGNDSGHAGKAETRFHQDGLGNAPVSMSGLNFWIALAPVSPESGSMRFYSGSHRFGNLGPDPRNHPYSRYWKLSEPLTYRPGDATAHFDLTVHGAPVNETDRPRWGYINSYFPADAVYLGSAHRRVDALRERGEATVGAPLDHPEFPLVFVPEGYRKPAEIDQSLANLQ
ncbi:phytanoyl-CoA dioxygenase family protein [Amycolatopsis thermophila]|uniref:Phytanoyl-CoA dioxygenase n=1 Tax=Amycolatopsis thermophila TaxID=206084 RepID=A0ABU0F6T3_9PSEU|nr:phytanoyl-CoA dioxygenase family protein [Amycolatopsis thermophila]MDQ0382717.1 hypothetical protein [Amycolatopsis thermophila]